MTSDLETLALEILGEMVGFSEAEREEVLDQHCHDNRDLRAAVDELWHDYTIADRQGFLKSPAWELVEGSTKLPLMDDLQSSETASRPKTLGRFEFIKSLGEGSQGEVWLACDPELRRDVAIKFVPARLRGAEQILAKFRREAEITGRLEHPNIVPIYEAGHDDQGQPFYAMRVLRGDHLQVAIDQFHRRGWSESGLRELLNRFLDICDAVAFAHQQGIVHRDLKPLNVMLGQYGETLVADWGMAKVVGQSDDIVVSTVARPGSDSSAKAFATHDGDVFGTVEYMAPEQAAGRTAEVGVASDQYSLGAILFCILTGQAPIGAQEKPRFRPIQQPLGPTIEHVLDETKPNRTTPGSSPLPDRLPLTELLGLAVRGEFPKPRKLVAQIPVALEAICLKAMSLAVDGRYASVTDMAQDVKHWLNDEPVLACSEPWPVRSRRWVKRHRAAAASLLLTTIGVISFSVIQWQHSTTLNAQKTIAAREASGRQRALIVAVESLESQTELVRHEDLLRQPQMLSLRMRLLQHALSAYDKWATPEVDSRETVSRVAKQLLQVAESVEETVSELQLLQNGVDRSTSESAVKQAQELLASFLKLHADDTSANTELEILLISAGRLRADILLNRGDIQLAEQQYEASLTLTDQLRSRRRSLSQSQTLQYAIERSRTIRGSAKVHFDLAMNASLPSDRRQHLTATIELLAPLKQTLESEQIDDITLGLEFAKVLNAIAIALHKGGQLTEETRRIGNFVLSPKRASEQSQPVPDAIKVFEHAIAVCDEIRTRLPDHEGFSSEQIAVDRLKAQIINNMTLGVRAIVREGGDWETPLALHERSRALRQGILDRHPWLLPVRIELAQSLGNIADTLSDCPDRLRELEARRSAIAVLRSAMTDFPSAVGIRQSWALHMVRLMTAYHRLQDDEQATQVFEETIGLYPTPEDAELTNLGHVLDTAFGWLLLAKSGIYSRIDATNRAEALVLRCHSIHGLHKVLLEQLRNEPVFRPLQERAAIQELLQRAESSSSATNSKETR